jgi:pimeloyl-ACP methyl ester carboxylesterase
MRQGQWIGGCAFIITVCLAGCQTAPSLTKAELVHKYPNKTYVIIDGVALHYEQDGWGPPLVFLHGLGISSYLWRAITPAFTYGHTIYTLDLMGFGSSEKPQNVTYNLNTYVEQLDKFLENFHLGSSTLVGHGLGALIATRYTMHHPDKVKNLVLMDVPLSAVPLPLSLRLLQVRLLGEMLVGEWFLTHLLHSGVENPSLWRESDLNAYLQPYHDDPGAWRALLKCLRECRIEPTGAQEIQPDLGTLHLPILLVWGGNDDMVPITSGRALHAQVPRARMQVILKSGHYIQEDRPEEVRAVLKTFLDG